jgi:hypothetical protein
MSENPDDTEGVCIDRELMSLLKAVRDGRIVGRERCLEIVGRGLSGIREALRKRYGDTTDESSGKP